LVGLLSDPFGNYDLEHIERITHKTIETMIKAITISPVKMGHKILLPVTSKEDGQSGDKQGNLN
jgi:hypothetical protein